MVVTRAGSASPARSGAAFSGPASSKHSDDQESSETKGKLLKSNLSPLSKGKAVLKYSLDSPLPNVIEDDVGGSNELKEGDMHASVDLIGKKLKRKHVALSKSKVSAKKSKKLSIEGSSRVKCKANRKIAKKNVGLLDKPKHMECFIKHEDHYRARVNFHCGFEKINVISEKLTDSQQLNWFTMFC
ncbi:uncharacterized protein LOC133784651 [Humulus lupulus]|uniref:uncharacterized protein LOC133784651 n=1 Tax=Humulus lupulus TaxID=3486 RepID=UPI002B40E138|nr:uncharacterized protein LOC133784651 [Humulus lupulus]